MVITNDGKQNTEKYLNLLKIIKKQGYRLICQTSIYIYIYIQVKAITVEFYLQNDNILKEFKY